MPLLSLPPLLSACAALALSGFVFFKNPRSAVNRTFALLCFETFFWQACWFWAYLGSQESIYKNLVIRIAWVTVVFIPFTYYEFAVRFLGLKRELRGVRLAYASACLFLVLAWSGDLFIAGFHEFWWGYYTKAGPLHPFYLIIVCCVMLRALILLRRGARDPAVPQSERHRRRLAFYAHSIYAFAALEL